MTSPSLSSVALGLLVALIASPADARPVAPIAATTIERDSFGVPHVFAGTTREVFRGFGYALAEDQLYQLEILRRTAEGRVAAVLGSKYLPHDQAARSHIDVAGLRAQYDRLPPEDRAIFDGMAAGISLRVSTVLADRTLLTRDFTDSAFLPERWTAIDVIMVYEHSMALRFSDFNSELDNLALLTRLQQARGAEAGWRLFEELRPVSDPAATTTITSRDAHAIAPLTFAGSDVDRAHAFLPNGLKPLAGSTLHAAPVTASAAMADVPHASNAWLASPSRVTSGDAVFVNGPQMGDFKAAYLWSIGLHGAGFNVVGSGPIGSPYLIFATNGAIGWGGTAGLGDTVDMYQLRLATNDDHRYWYDGSWLPMSHRAEVIEVKGEPARTLDVYSTVHGPVDLFDLPNRTAYARRRTWAGSEVASLVTWVHAMKATDYSTWRALAAVPTISVNDYYIDRAGNIGYQFLGLFPKRPRQQDFRLPATGDGTMEWQGFASQLDNPHVLNPSDGIIANWNNKPQPGYNNPDWWTWTGVDRVEEISRRLASPAKLSPDQLWNVVRETAYADVNAHRFRDLIAAHASGWRSDGNAAAAAQILATWNGLTDDPVKVRAEPGYVLFKAFLKSLLTDIFTPVLPTAAGPERDRAEAEFLHFDPLFPRSGVKIAYAALSSHEPTVLLEGRDPGAVITRALAAAFLDVTSRFGKQPDAWNEPSTPHVFARENYAGIPSSTEPDAMSLPVHMNRGTENDRMIVHDGHITLCDVTPPGQSAFVSATGVHSEHWRDQLDLYASFGCKPQYIDPADVHAHAVSSEQLPIDVM